MVLIFVPPLWTEGTHYLYVETIQFCLAAYVVPALVVLGRPLSLFGAPRDRAWKALEWLGTRRKRHPSYLRSFAVVAVDAALVMLWRTPTWTNAAVQHRWVEGVEAASLVAAGIALWLELVDCPPMEPRLHRPWRAVVATLAMWATWVMSFAVGFAADPWYHIFAHPGRGFGALADQQVATGLLWLTAVCTFLPVIFADVMTWLKNDEDPDAELRKLVRAARRSGNV